MPPTSTSGKMLLKPGEFRFVTNGLSIESDDGRRRFKTIASSTTQDLRKDEMAMSAMQDMAASFRGGLNIFFDHNHTAENVFGRSDSAEIKDSGEVDPRTGAKIWDLHIGGVVNEPNQRAVQLADSIDGGYVSFGTSVGVFILGKPTKNPDGGRVIEHVKCLEASIVGIPMHQRAWTYKSADANWTGRAAAAAARMDGDNTLFDGLDDDPEDAPVEGVIETLALDPSLGIPEGVEVVAGQMAEIGEDGPETVMLLKGDLSSKERSDMPADEFACPEKRLYPINDAAHVRAALSRVADPSNDQCGRDKIIAAAKRMGIGEHGDDKKELTDIDLLLWASTTPCADCGHEKSCDCSTCDCAAHGNHDNDAAADADLDGKSAADMLNETDPTTDGQDANAATPETAPEAEAVTDPAPVQKALAFEADDVVELVKHVRDLAEMLGERDTKIASLSEALTTKSAEADRLAEDNDEARRVIEKLLTMPLRRKAVSDIEGLDRKLPNFLAPEVKSILSRIGD